MAERSYSECRYALCHYVECHGALQKCSTFHINIVTFYYFAIANPGKWNGAFCIEKIQNYGYFPHLIL